MNPVKRLIHTLHRRVEWTRSSHENTDQAKTLKSGDIVECAIENPDGVRYRIESIDHTLQEARVRRLAANGSETNELYTLAPVMLRLPNNKAS